jgi:hypothetical protein
MVTLLTLIILVLVPICGPQRGDGCAGRMNLGLSLGLGRAHAGSPSGRLLF